jgi:putative DNA primase/helicase
MSDHDYSSENTTRQAPDGAGITHAMRARLRARGKSDAEIDNSTRQQREAWLAGEPSAEQSTATNGGGSDAAVRSGNGGDADPNRIELAPPELVGYQCGKLPPTIIQIHNNALHGEMAAQIARLVDESADALIRHKVPIFTRGRMLVAALWEKRRNDLNQLVKVPALVPVDVDFLDYTLNKGVATYVAPREIKLGNGQKEIKLVPCGAPDKVLSRLLRVKHWKIPQCIGLTNCQTMRPDGSLLTEKGYDTATGVYAFWDDGCVLPPIPARPTKKDAQRALQTLLDLIAELPFVSAVDKAVAVAAIMTPVLRVAFDFVPLFLVLAHQSGTGKSFLQDVISAIVNGRRCPVVDISEDTAEMQKQLGALLLEGATIVALDNMDKDLKSKLLCQMITQSAIKVRILGKSEMPEVEWRGTLVANGDNIRVTKDLVRRTLTTNMNIAMERPETRKFNFNPVHEVLKDRGRYIAAVLTIALAYRVADDKVAVTPLNGLEAWTRGVREALVWLGMVDPVFSQEQSYADDPYRTAASRLLALWKEYFGSVQSFKAKDIFDAAHEKEPIRNEQGEQIWRTDGGPEFKLRRQEFYDLLMEQCSERGRIELGKFGIWLRSLHNQVYALTRLEGDQEVADGSYRLTIAVKTKPPRWKLEQVDPATAGVAEPSAIAGSEGEPPAASEPIATA